MQDYLQKISLGALVALGLFSTNAQAWDSHSLDRLLGDDYIDLADDAIRNANGRGSNPLIINNVVNIGEIDASVSITGHE